MVCTYFSTTFIQSGVDRRIVWWKRIYIWIVNKQVNTFVFSVMFHSTLKMVYYGWQFKDNFEIRNLCCMTWYYRHAMHAESYCAVALYKPCITKVCSTLDALQSYGTLLALKAWNVCRELWSCSTLQVHVTRFALWEYIFIFAKYIVIFIFLFMLFIWWGAMKLGMKVWWGNIACYHIT